MKLKEVIYTTRDPIDLWSVVQLAFREGLDINILMIEVITLWDDFEPYGVEQRVYYWREETPEELATREAEELKSQQLREAYAAKLAAAKERSERAELARLKALYETD